MSDRTRRSWPLWSGEGRWSEARVAATVAAFFVAGGLAWVILTDTALYSLTRDEVLIARIETAKGWIFVALGGILVYAATLRSASRLARAQALVSAVVESIADGVLLLGPDRTIVHANPAARGMLRCERDEVVGMGAEEFSRRFRLAYPDGSLVRPAEFISQRVFVEGGPLHYKAVLHPSSDSEVVISATAAAVRDQVGEQARMVVSVMHDITDSENLERMRDQFFAAAAHSLKTPVAVIKANAQILSREASPRLLRATGAIERQCGHIDRLVQNLLVLARARSRTLQLHPVELELASLVEHVAGEMAPATRDHEVRTEVLAHPRIHADEERIALVLRNVIDESFRSSPSGSPVTVRVTEHGRDAEVAIRFQPLPPEERMSEAYEEYGDRGISRSVVTTIVEAHGGALREEPAGIETTELRIRLPAEEREVEDAR